MRGPRRRRLRRSRRPFSKKKYQDSALAIQRCFRRFISNRYKTSCTNYNNDDYITLQPVPMIPRSVFIVVENVGFDARHFLKWTQKSNVHPVTRNKLPVEVQKLCLRMSAEFLMSETHRIRKKKGYFSRKRKYNQSQLQLLL